MDTPQGEKGLSHSDHAYWVLRVTSDHPEMALFLNGKRFMGLLDTGADVSVVAERHWPSTWPCVQATADLKGVVSATAPLQSACAISWHDDEGHSGTFLPYVLKDLPVNLWGRDVLQEMGAILYSPSAKASHMCYNRVLILVKA
jgi:hypothetical protein